MEPFEVLCWITISLMCAMIVSLVAVLLVFLFTRWCRKGRVDDTGVPPVMEDPFSSGPRGVDPTVIETFPKFTYNAVHGRKMCRGMLVCVICLAVFKEDETLRCMPKCGHVFHSHCVDSWLKTHATCPCCRASLVPKPCGLGLLKVLPAGLVRLV